MKKLGMWVLLLSTLACGNDVYTVDDLIIKALKNSPDLEISKAQYDISKSKVDTATSSYLPKVDLHLSAGEAGQSDIANNQNEILNDTLVLGKLSLKQIVYDFGKTGSNVGSIRYDSNALKMSYEQIISNKKRDVKVAYYNILRSIALIKVQDEHVKLTDIQLYRSKKYFDAGIRTIIDISDAEVNLIKAQLDLKNAQYDLKIAYSTLDKTVGFKELENNYEVYSYDLNLTNLYSSINDYPLSLKESINYAYENRSELKQYKAQIDSAKEKRSLARSQYYPSLYLGADYTKQSVDKFQNYVPEDQWQASLNLDWNLYEGGSTNAQTQEKNIEIQKAQSEFENTKLAIKNITTESYINLYKAKDAVLLSQNLVKASHDKFIQASKRYEAGLSDYIELEKARQDYIDAKASLVVNYYTYYQAVAYLDNAIGK